jgi:hypothetical protein
MLVSLPHTYTPNNGWAASGHVQQLALSFRKQPPGVDRKSHWTDVMIMFFSVGRRVAMKQKTQKMFDIRTYIVKLLALPR